MKRATQKTAAIAVAAMLFPAAAAAQTDGRPRLHVNPRWEECSFQLDPALSQSAWRQFTEEAGLVVAFRPLADALPMGKGHFEISVHQWEVGIDDTDAAWNDTFVHPDSTHWLFDGDRLKFPGLMVRAGITDRTDVSVYATKNPNANYGFFGGQLQRSLVAGSTTDWAASARASFVSMFGPEDLDFSLFSVDLLASRRLALASWASVSPYAGVSTYLARSHEKTAAVDLDDESVLGAQGMVDADLLGRPAAHEGEVALVGLVRHERRAEQRGRPRVAREQQHARGALVEPVDRMKPRAEARLQQRHHRARVMRIERGAMHEQARRLVHRERDAVVVEHRQFVVAHAVRGSDPST